MSDSGVNLFTRQPIERWWMLNSPNPEDRAWPNTPKFYIGLSKMTEVGPLKIQHLFRSAFADQLDGWLETSEVIINKRQINEPADLPFLGRLSVRKPRGYSASSPQKVKKLDEKYNKIIDRTTTKIMTMDKDEFKDFMEKKGDTSLVRETYRQMRYATLLKNTLRSFDQLHQNIRKERLREVPDNKIIEKSGDTMVNVAQLALIKLANEQNRKIPDDEIEIWLKNLWVTKRNYDEAKSMEDEGRGEKVESWVEMMVRVNKEIDDAKNKISNINKGR